MSAPAPFVPADVDLRDFPGFMLNTERLLASELWALSSGPEFKAAVGLWARAWKQVPAASLPDDDKTLAAFSGAGTNWKKVKAMALRGFIKCSDGRLYHKVLAEDAIGAWIDKLNRRNSSGSGNAERWGKAFEKETIEAKIEQAYRALEQLNPESKKLSRKRPDGAKSSSRMHPDDIPPGSHRDTIGTPTGIPPGIPNASRLHPGVSCVDQTGTETDITLLPLVGECIGEISQNHSQANDLVVVAEQTQAVEAWNQLAERLNLSKVQRLTGPRKTKLRRRLAECGGIAGWHEALGKLEKIPWMLGDNDRGWRADFDFLCQEKSFTRLMEGSYDRDQNPSNSAGSRGRQGPTGILAAIAEVVADA